MGLAAFQSLKLPDRLLQTLQGNIAAVFSSLTQVPIVQGVLASYTVPQGGLIFNSDFTVSHTLGRTPTAIIPAIAPSYAAYQVSPTANQAPTTTMILQCDVNQAAGAQLYFWVL